MNDKLYTCQTCGGTFTNPDEGKMLVVFGSIGFIVHRTCLEGDTPDG